jgi:hypothetical protein
MQDLDCEPDGGGDMAEILYRFVGHTQKEQFQEEYRVSYDLVLRHACRTSERLGERLRFLGHLGIGGLIDVVVEFA